MFKPVGCAALAVLATLLLSIPALAQQAPPSADTFVSSATPNLNYGSSVVLAVGSGTVSYMRFNLSAVPAGSTVTKATLRLYVDAVVAGGQFDVYNLPKSPTWTERTLTFSSPPPPLGSSATGGHPINVTSASMNNFLLIDLTSTVQGWLADPTSNNGLALGEVVGTGWFSFDSKESFLTAHQPELEIVTAGQGGGQGPQGPQGPQGLQGVAGPAGPKGDTGLAGPAGTPGSVGPQGLTGNTGPQGLMGLPGSAGPAGPAGTNGTGFNFRNAFDASATYAVNDVATFSGATYVATAANAGPNNPTPDNNTAAWTLMAAQGAAGPAGTAGPAGPAGPVGQTGAQGVAGPPGPTGPAGPTGGVSPTSDIFNASFNNLSVSSGTVYYLAPNTTASPNNLENLGIIYNGGPNLFANFVVVPDACTVAALKVGAGPIRIGRDVATFTVWRNQAPTTMTCTVSLLIGASCVDVIHTFGVAAGDVLTIAFEDEITSPVKYNTTILCN